MFPQKIFWDFIREFFCSSKSVSRLFPKFSFSNHLVPVVPHSLPPTSLHSSWRLSCASWSHGHGATPWSPRATGNRFGTGCGSRYAQVRGRFDARAGAGGPRSTPRNSATPPPPGALRPARVAFSVEVLGVAAIALLGAVEAVVVWALAVAIGHLRREPLEEGRAGSF